MSDGSTLADQLRFTRAIETAGICSVAIAQAVKHCPVQVPGTVEGLLGFTKTTTFAQAAEAVMVKHRNAAMARQAR